MPGGQARGRDPRSSPFLSAREACSQSASCSGVGKQAPKASGWTVRVWVSGPDLLRDLVQVTRGSDTQCPHSSGRARRGVGGWEGPG